MTLDRWFAVISAGAAVLAVLISYWSILVTKRIARKSGWNKAPKVNIGFGALRLRHRKPLRAAYGIDSAVGVSRLLLLPVAIWNEGERSAEQVNVEITFPKGASTEKAS